MNLKAAKDSYEKCIKINSNYLEAYIGLGRILLDLMNLAESKKIYAKVNDALFVLETNPTIEHIILFLHYYSLNYQY